VIRDATAGDREALWPLWAECLRLHGATPDPAVFAQSWAMALGGQGYGLRVAAPGEAILGFALHGWHPNSWTGATDGTLDTLFVAEAARGRGVATALLDDLLALARARGWRTVVWHVERDNAPARRLYDRYARPDGYLRYRAVP
jgi:ribosomal protein S18 acetylase RimI-like enzyme